MTKPLVTYLRTLERNLQAGITTEHSHRAALAALFEALAPGVQAINEPQRIACGAPDLAILKDGLIVGYVEAKDVGIPLAAEERSEQLRRYRRSLENLILTDYLEFRWYVDGELRRTARLARLDAYDRLQREPQGDVNVRRLLQDFLAHEPQPIATPRELAERMARLTHLIWDTIVAAFEQGKASDLLTGWRQAFAEVLLPDLDEPENLEQFADMFAQTLAYGLFSARIMHESGTFTRHRAQTLIPRTNPFLRDFFSYITGPQLNDEPYAGFVNELVQILAQSDMAAILADFGRRTQREDPMVHFYETFLAAYDPDLRERRGVHYTPNPIVSFIVRSVDALLRSHFGLPDGLADTTRLPDGTHKVLTLDPATGTATFLYAVIDLIREDFMLQGNAGMWSGYVKDHLLERIFGFELLMAPYAVAHFKLALQLAGHDLPEAQQKEWAYDFGSDERLQIYLTNALEKAVEESPRLIGPTQIVAQEAQAADRVKQETPIMVIVGNPPYAVSSANKSDYIEDLMDRYKEAVRDERNIQPLSDDYIKFIRFAHDRVERTGYGIIGFITSHSYLFGLIHRGMREELLKTFDEIYVLNLHGNARMGETTPDGGMDENVFDIQQGVAITLMIKTGESQGPATVYYADLWGRRENKYHVLNDNDVQMLDWETLQPVAPYYFFVPKDFRLQDEYESGYKIDDIFPINSLGIEFGSKSHLLRVDHADLEQFVASVLLNPSVTGAKIARQYGLRTTSGWRFETLRQAEITRGYEPKSIVRCLESPFNTQYTYYAPLLRRPQHEILRNMLLANIALLAARQSRSSETGMYFVTKHVYSKDAVSIRDRATGFPLYLYPEEDATTLFDDTATSPWEPDPDHGNRVPNLSKTFVDALKEKLGLKFRAFQPHPRTPSPNLGRGTAGTHNSPSPQAGRGPGGGVIHPPAEGEPEGGVTHPPAEGEPEGGVTQPQSEREPEGGVAQWQTEPDLWAKLKPRARKMRKEPTPAEDALWQRLRNHQLRDTKFRRQHVIGPFIVDFYAREPRLIVEVDGPIHEEQREADAARQEHLENLGYRVLRFTNARVLHEMETVLDEIGAALQAQQETFTPEDVLAYIYALFHSPTYRERYAEFLKIDFPRVPLTSDVDLFWRLVELGNELIQLHLMEHPKLRDTFTSFPVKGSNRVKPRGGFPKFVPEGESRTKTGEEAQRNRVYINPEQYFAGVPEEVWEFEVGGYQVLHKWLKDRKGHVLDFDDLRHYQRIVVALQETLHLMDEIDEAIPAWPVE